MIAAVPVIPDGPTAQRWITDELQKAEYQAAKPTWFDIASNAIREWLGTLFSGKTGSVNNGVWIIVALLLRLSDSVRNQPRLVVDGE